MIEVTRWKRRNGEGVVLEAIQWTGIIKDLGPLYETWAPRSRYRVPLLGPEPAEPLILRIDTLGGTSDWLPGGWLVQCEDGDLRVFGDEHFHETFKPAEEGR